MELIPKPKIMGNRKMDTEVTVRQVGSAKVTFTSDRVHHELLDTEVQVGGDVLCTICGDQIYSFLEDFNRLVERYRI